jgi:hypothetical protein
MAKRDHTEPSHKDEKDKKGHSELEKEIRKSIRPQVNRSRGLVVSDDAQAMEFANAELTDLYEKAVARAFHDKLKLLLRRYSLEDDDWYGLALNLAIQYEPGFQVEFPLTVLRLTEQSETTDAFSGPVRVSSNVGKQRGRPRQWSFDRLEHLLKAVRAEKKKSGLKEDLDVLKRLARQKEWSPPRNHRSSSPRGEADAWVRTLQSRLHDAKKMERLLADAEKSFREAGRGTSTDK